MKLKFILPIIFLILVTTVSAQVTEDIPINKGIADSFIYGFDWELDHSDLENFQDTEIMFQGDEYYVHDILILNKNSPSVETSLTSGDDDYESNIFLEVYSRNAIRYYHVFDDVINISKATTTNPLEIKFLGKTIKITRINSDTSFTAYVGNEYLMHIRDIIIVENKQITLENVGSGGSVIIDVGGVQETIPASTAEIVNGIEIYNDETFYADPISQRVANLFIGNPALGTFKDGDEFIGEDPHNPQWTWNIKNLNQFSSTTITQDDTGIHESGPIIGIENYFIADDDADDPVGLGDCYDLPNNYASICLDSLTVSDDDYLPLIIEYKNNVDLSGVGLGSSEKTIYIHAPGDDRFILTRPGENGEYNEHLMKVGDAVIINDKRIILSNVGSGGSIVVDVDGVIGTVPASTSEIVNEIEITNLETYYEDTKSERSARLGLRDTVILTTTTYTNTSEIWITMINETEFGIYYRDTKQIPNIVYYGSSLGRAGDTVVNYKNTADDISLILRSTEGGVYLELGVDEDPYMQIYTELLRAFFKIENEEIISLGNTPSLSESNELLWVEGLEPPEKITNIGTKDEDHRSIYGIIIKDPKSNGNSDKVVLEIPSDQVQANVIIESDYTFPEPEPVPQTEYDINLNTGWNLFSIPFTQNDTKTETVISDIKDKVEVIYSYKQGSWKAWINNYPGSNTLTNLEEGYGYFIKLTQPAILHIEGKIGIGEPPTIPTFNVYTGWNLIGYYGTEDTIAFNALRNIWGEYSAIWTLYNNNVQSLQGTFRGFILEEFNEEMKRTHGYWLYMKEAGIIVPTN